MRVMMVASNAFGKATLRLEQEITRLQLVALEHTASTVEFVFFPALRFEELQQRIWQTKPDILHFCAHGEEEYLTMSNALEEEVKVTGDVLRGLLSGVERIKLIYLSVCKSAALAELLVESGVSDMAIGTTQPITNLAAREGAVVFYQNLLKGRTVRGAYEAGKAIILGLGRGVETNLFCSPGVSAEHEQIYVPLKILARFDNEAKPIDGDGIALVELGVVGCPPTTNQVIFFTDDESFIVNRGHLESNLSEIVRTQAVNGEIWLDETCWTAIGNYRIYACLSTLDGRTCSLVSDLCSALTDCIELERLEATAAPETIRGAIEQLKLHDGAQVVHRRKKTVANKQSKMIKSKTGTKKQTRKTKP